MTEAEELLQKVIRGSGRRSHEAIRSPLAGHAAPMGFGIEKRKEGLETPPLVLAKVRAMSVYEAPLEQQEIPLRRPEVEGVGWRRSAAELQEEKWPRRDFEILNNRAVRGMKVTAPGRIKGFRRFMEKWGFSRKDAAEILGFENAGLIGELYAGIEKMQQRDVRDRLRLFLSLAVDLDDLYDDDQVIKQWLDEPKKLLRGKTPRELLVEGSMVNLLRVQQLVQYEANR